MSVSPKLGYTLPLFLSTAGIRVIDVRDEVTAVFAADAVACLTGLHQSQNPKYVVDFFISRDSRSCDCDLRIGGH